MLSRLERCGHHPQGPGPQGTELRGQEHAACTLSRAAGGQQPCTSTHVMGRSHSEHLVACKGLGSPGALTLVSGARTLRWPVSAGAGPAIPAGLSVPGIKEPITTTATETKTRLAPAAHNPPTNKTLGGVTGGRQRRGW